LQAKEREIVSITDFHANGVDGAMVDPTGAIASHLGIQAAIDTGKSLFFPEGTYKIGATLTCATNGQVFFGAGSSKSILRTDTDIKCLDVPAAQYGVNLKDLGFYCSLGDAGGPTQFQFHAKDAQHCVIQDCSFNTALTGSVVNDTFHAGVDLEGGNLNNILDCTFGQSHIQMGSTDSTIRGGFVYSFSMEYAIAITSAGEVVCEGIRGILGGTTHGCIYIPNASYLNKIIGCYFGGTYDYMNIGNGITAQSPQMMQIIGNTFHEVDGIGVHLIDAIAGNTIVGNTFWAGDPKQNDATLLIPGNPDIYIEGVAFAAQNTIITGNVFDRFDGPVEGTMPAIGKSYAIQFGGVSGTGYNSVIGNTFAESGQRYFTPAVTGDNVTSDRVHSNVGSVQSDIKAWTPAAFGIVLAAGTTGSYQVVGNVMHVWAKLVFPVTADGNNVTILGLPLAPFAGTEGPVLVKNPNIAAAAAAKFDTGLAQISMWDAAFSAQATNAACSGATFYLSGSCLVA